MAIRFCKDLRGRLARWVLTLSEFEYTIQYKPGNRNRNADALSRSPVKELDEWDESNGMSQIGLKSCVSIEQLGERAGVWIKQ